jgi:hypothetical protein
MPLTRMGEWRYTSRRSTPTMSVTTYEGVSKSFWTSRLKRELQMVQFSATRWNCIAILWLSLVSFAAMTICVESRDSSVVIALGYGLHDRNSRVRFPAGLGTFIFTTASRTTLGPTQLPIQGVPGALSLGIKRPGYEADHSLPSSVEVKEWVALKLHSPITP